jgi:tellurite resistance protein TerC
LTTPLIVPTQGVSTLLWVLFNAGVMLLLWADLRFFHQRASEIPVRSALRLSAFWILLALLFNVYIGLTFGNLAALDFLTAYLIEKSLSVDNLFVFLLIFTHFQVAKKYQHRVLYYGILGALIMRALFIYVGVSLLAHFEYLIYVLGAFLLFSGAKLIKREVSSEDEEEEEEEEEKEEEQPKLLEFFSRVSKKMKDPPGSEGNFFAVEGGWLRPTRLFIVLLCVELCDVIFALDSIPAVLAISNDPFIIYSSNICAILGLRALFFALAGLMSMFRYLDHGLAIILMFVGAKMMLKSVVEIPSWISLLCIALILGTAVILSLLRPIKDESTTDSDVSIKDASSPPPEF